MPVFVTVITYRTESPATNEPPLISVAVFVDVVKFGKPDGVLLAVTTWLTLFALIRALFVTTVPLVASESRTTVTVSLTLLPIASVATAGHETILPACVPPPEI